MAISGDQCLDKNDPDYGLPLDTCCVGMGGPSPMEVTTISQGMGKAGAQGGTVKTVVSGLTGGN